MPISIRYFYDMLNEQSWGDTVSLRVEAETSSNELCFPIYSCYSYRFIRLRTNNLS